MKLKLASSLVTSLINTGVVTLVLALKNNGLPLDVVAWLLTWALAAAIIFPMSLVIPQRVRAFFARFFPEDGAAPANSSKKEGLHNEAARH